MNELPEYIFNSSQAYILRMYAGLTQKDVAQKMDISPSVLSRFEHGKGNLNQNQITEYARIIKCHPGAFWTETGTSNSPFSDGKLQDMQSA